MYARNPGKACSLASFARGGEGDHVRLLRIVSKDVVGRISACLRKIGCRCVLDESQKTWESAGVQKTSPVVIGFLAL